AILLDDNNRKPVVRLFFNTRQKYLGLFDESRNCERVPIESPAGIYGYADQIREEVRRLL
ncbi:restriction endonuclease or methylase, partial [Bifidobacterium vansinderenii]